MIILEDDRLVFRFPEVHPDAACSIEMQRTLRIPDDSREHWLPPGLGRFPLRHLDDFAPRLPERWHARGGVIAPMHQAEAMWLNFNAGDYPFAVKVATGKVCAVSGDAWCGHLNRDPQDYAVIPTQPWLDGYCVEKGTIRQFVAMPLGKGYSVEEQLTGAAEHGGLQIMVWPMKAARYERLVVEEEHCTFARHTLACMAPDMGLAPGGRTRQEIYDDPHGLDAWDQRHGARCFVTIANSAQWMAIAGERPPTEPPTAQAYTEAGLPWFEHYDADAKAIAGAEKLAKIRSVRDIDEEEDLDGWPETELVAEPHVVPLGPRRRRPVREASF